ncbi:acetyltransferase [Lacihabitans soyangensis]|uniref:Acetyltransferase n=1 Tax=Lacihabitans soyangensis TaxID=869394 RepID=A0AAE3KXL7_9BACT|nr:acetyltransferase [Lacihabitans soyangensis]MCP9765340.1 acetyltransferase [Lacihabitans soyangensis]
MLVIGAGGHALEILDVLLQDNYPHPIYFYDDITPSLTSFRGFPVVKNETMLKEIYPANFFFVLGIGNPIHRKNMYEKFKSLGGDLSSVISNKSVHSSQLINKEFDLMNLCYLGPETNIGKGTLINTGAQIHHEVEIGEFTEISPRALLLGKVKVGNLCSLGGNCTILPKIRIGNNVIVGAGTVVTSDVPDNKLIVGVPGKIIKSL